MQGIEGGSLAGWKPLPEGHEQYSLEFIRSQGLVKLAENEKRVTVGSDRELDETTLLRLESFHRKAIRTVLLDRAEFAAWLSRRLSAGSEAKERLPASGLSLEGFAADAPTVTLVNSICIDAIRRHASDIHIDSLVDGVRVRYRIDGVLATVRRLDPTRFSSLASRIKVMTGLNIMERRRPQDGRTTVELAGMRLDMRVSCVPTAGPERGESIVLRLFNAADELIPLSRLGFEPEISARLAALLRRPHGMILATGPTGSGKSTTLNAMIRSIASEALKIITIEDPVEYLIEGVDQIQTNTGIGLGFEALLRRVLRQDPDVLLIGEIRDRETAKLAVRAALTGHLVLSTLHTNDAVSAVGRLRDLGIEPYLIAAVLRGVLAQRLVRRLCPLCRRPGARDADRAGLLYPPSGALETLYESVGCDACEGLGYKGRFAVAEFFECDTETAGLIASSADTQILRSSLERRGMRPLRSGALKAAANGETTLGDLERAGAL